MKKLVMALATLFLCGTVFSQVFTPVTATVYGEHKNRAKIDSSLLFPTGCGSPVQHSAFLKMAMLYFDSCAHRFWAYDPKTLVWDSVHVGVASSGGGTVYVDSAFSRNDSLYYKKNGIEYFVKKLQPYGSYLSPSDTANKWVNSITRTPGKDSIIFYIGSTRYAVKDSIGGGSGGSGDSSWVDVKNYFQVGVTLASSTRQQRIDAWQAAIADAQTKGYGIHYSGWWDIRTDSVVITDKLTIQGVGMYSSLTTTDSMGVCLKIDIPTTRAYYEVIFPTYKPVVLQDFQVLYTGSATPDATSRGIKDNCTNSINFQHRFERITVDSFYTGIELHNIASSHIYECYFRGNRAYGILNTNSESNDYGKLVIDKCVFAVSASIVGAPDTSAHIKWEGGAGLTVTNNDFYGYSDYAVWVNLKNTTEVFASAGSTEFSFKHNRALFLNDYAFLFDTDFGKGDAGTAFDGNKIEHIQIQDNMTGINGLLKTVGGTASIFDVQVTGNSNVYPYLGTAKIPIVINGLAMTNYTMADNIFNGILFTTGTGFPGITKAVSVTGGSISGVVKACNNTYIGYGTAPDVADTCASPGSWTTNTAIAATFNQAMTVNMAGFGINYSGGNFGIGRVPAVPLDILGTGNTYFRLTRPNNANDVMGIFVPNGALSNSNAQFAFGIPGGQSYFSPYQRYDGTTVKDFLQIPSSGNSLLYDGNITFTDNTYDIGASGATRPRTGYFGTSLISPIVTVTGRLHTAQGASVASTAGAMTLGNDGNTFEITGTNTITLLSKVGWSDGDEVTLIFTSTATLVHGTTTSGNNITMLLTGGVDFIASADDVVKLKLCTVGGVQAWRCISISLNHAS